MNQAPRVLCFDPLKASQTVRTFSLQDTLSKFEGRTLKDCGEDLLVEISEILFNELAFFRLMQDLDSSNTAKHKSKQPEDLQGQTRQSVKVRL